MTDREKVIKCLRIERECVSRDCDRDCAKCDLVQDREWLLSVYDDALELLEEQEPKLVRYTASTVRCPNCNKQITTKGCIHREIKYCWKCGQAVKWND